MKYFYYSKTENTFYIKKKYRNSNKNDRYTNDLDLKEIDNLNRFISEVHEILKFEKISISLYPIIRNSLVIAINSEKMPLYLHNLDAKSLNVMILEFPVSKDFKILSDAFFKLSNEAKLKIELM